MIVLTRILVATDFSQPSQKALLYGRAFAEKFGASLHVLHVVEEPFVHAWTSQGYLAALPSFREHLEREAREQMARAFPESERATGRAETAVRLGQPYREIVGYAREKNVDLIVMGTHGRSHVAHLLMGSVAEKVVRAAPCPVLTVRHPEQEFVIP
jgi:nucleotide-binding universal stress UspA family protein